MVTFRVLSMGWGRQTWTLAAMMALGEYPVADYIVHADTTHEKESTYAFAHQWQPWLEERGVKVRTVSRHTGAVDQWGGLMIPAFTQNKAVGQLRRQCTSEWKIAPIRRFIVEELSRRSITKSGGVVEQWIGISTDEWSRARTSDVRYIVNRHPLIDLKMGRASCIAWLKEHDLPVPAKSSCTFCPYHSKRAWQDLKRAGGEDWAQAVEIDRQIRSVRPPWNTFVHPSLKPLAEAVSIAEDVGYEQLPLSAIDWPRVFTGDDQPDDDGSCPTGVCFV